MDQGPFLFSDTIRNNIAFAYPEASHDDIFRMVCLAGLEPDIKNFPEGLETLVGERGVSLSGGQKQRIALARALLGRPKILILDDAFSSLDVETEEKVLFALRKELKKTATLVITHRLSTARDADEIIVMEEGRIIQRGEHARLASTSGYYKNVLKNQIVARKMEFLIK